MEKENFNLASSLAELSDSNRSHLVKHYQQKLQRSLFNSRSKMRPNMLRQIAADEVDAFISFLQQPNWDASERGVQLHQVGLSVLPLMELGQVTRQFFVTRLETEQIPAALEVIDAYQNEVVQGFIYSLEKSVFDVQERTRHAFERVVNRDKP